MRSSKNDAQRLPEIDAARQTTGNREGELQRIVVEAAAIARAPIALISIIDRNRQGFAVSLGLDPQAIVRLEPICSRVILRPGEPLIILDAHQHKRYALFSPVIDAPFIRYFLGIPLVDRAGYALGALSVADTIPRREIQDLGGIERLAREAERFITTY